MHAVRAVAWWTVRRLVLVCVTALACGPSPGPDEVASGFGSDATSASTGTPAETSSDAESETSSMPVLDTSSGAPPAVGGTELWKIVLPTLDPCPRMAALDDGGVVVVGWESFPNDNAIPHFVVVEGDGSIRWATQGGHDNYDTTRDVVAEPGGFVVVGRVSGYPDPDRGWIQRWSANGPKIDDVLFAEGELGGYPLEIDRRDGPTFWTIADDARGEHLYARGFDAPPTAGTPLASVYSVHLAAAPDAGAYVASDHVEAMLTRFDGDGVAMWTLAYDGATDPPPGVYAVASAPDGDAIVTGKDEDGPWIRRFDPDGRQLWRVPVDVGALADKDYPDDVAADAMGDIVVVGRSRVPDERDDAFLAKYSADGVELWQQTWASADSTDITTCDVVATSDGTVVVAGIGIPAGESGEGYWLRGFTP